jgi:hypothetical protein
MSHPPYHTCLAQLLRRIKALETAFLRHPRARGQLGVGEEVKNRSKSRVRRRDPGLGASWGQAGGSGGSANPAGGREQVGEAGVGEGL